MIYELEQATVKQLQEFIDVCMRTTSEKTGRPIKINTFKWTKSRLIDLIIDCGYRLDAIQFINGEF